MERQDHHAWLFLAPAIIVLIFVGALPLAINAWHSLHDIFTLDTKYWVGGEWYAALLGSPRLYQSLGRSCLFSVIILTVQVPLGLAIAMMLPRSGPVRTLALILLAIPLMVPWNMIPPMWLSLINPETGVLGQMMAFTGIHFDHKFNAVHTWLLIVLMDTWHWVGLIAILACSGLSGIAPAYYQAAAIDQATRLQVFRYIELPKLMGVMTMALLLRFMDSFMIYTEAFGINAGGPRNATAFLSLDLGEEIKAFNYGPAAARSVLYFAITLVIAWSFWTLMRRQEGQDNGHPA